MKLGMKKFIGREEWCIIGLCLISLVNSVPYWNTLMQDDTYIHLRYVRNLLHGYGFSFNPGEPTYGCTSPLWVILLTIPALFVGASPLLALILSVLFNILSVITFYLLSKRLIKNKILVLAATFAWTMNPALARWSGSGMESSVSAFLVLWSILVFLKEKEQGKRLFSPLLLALATLTRPEFLLLFFLCCLDIAISWPGQRRSFALLQTLGFYSLLMFPWLTYAYLSFGTLVPNTALAKGAYAPILSNIIEPLSKIFIFMGGACFIPLLLLGWGSIQNLTKIGLNFRLLPSKLSFHFVPLGWIIGVPILYIVENVYITERYLLITYPIIIVYAFLLSKQIFLRKEEFQEKLRAGILTAVVFLIFVYSLAISFFIERPYVLGRIKQYQFYKFIGEWFSQNTPKDTVIAVNDIGIVGYYSNRRIVDPLGLVTPDIISYRARGKRAIKYMKEIKPDYCVIGTPREKPIRFKQSKKSNCAELLFFRAIEIPGLDLSMSNKVTLTSKKMFVYVYKLNW